MLRRYLRFCKDQHAFLFLCWRRRVGLAELTKKELIGFKIRINLRKQRQYHLRDPQTGELVKDPTKLGVLVEYLPPCLNPDLTEAQRRDPALMGQRYLSDVDDLF